MKKLLSFSLIATSMVLGVSVLANTSRVAKAESNVTVTTITGVDTWTTDTCGNEFIMLHLGTSDFPSDWSIANSYNYNISGKGFTLDYLDYVLIDGEPMSTVMTKNGATPYAWEAFINFYLRPGTFTFRGFNHEYDMLTFKAGFKIPSWTYATGGEESYYGLDKDVYFKRASNNHTVGSSDSWAVYVPPYTYEGESQTTTATACQFRSGDSSTYWLKISLSNQDYNSAANNTPLLKETYFTNLNTLENIYLRCFDGSEYRLDKLVTGDFQLKHWGEPCVWFGVDSTIFGSNAKTQEYISAIVIKDGCEFPSFSGEYKYVIDKETQLAFADGSAGYTDEVGTGFSFDSGRTEFGEKNLGHRSTRECLGVVEAKPTKDAANDTFNVLWISVTGADYEDSIANKQLPMLTFYGLNTFEKIKVDGEPMSLKYRFGDGASCINKFTRPSCLALGPNGTFDYRTIKTVTIEAGCEFPSVDNTNDGFYGDRNIKYYKTDTTVTFDYVSEKEDFFKPINVFFDGVETKVYEGTTIPSSCLPKDPTKEGTATTDYAFEGWYIKGTSTKFDVTKDIPTEGLELESHYRETAKQYTVTYYNEDGTVYKTVKVPNGEAFTLIDTPSKTGYSGTWVGTEYDVMPTSDISYTVSYTANQYNLTFEGVNKAIVVTYDSPIGETLPTPPAKTGYTVDKWAIDGQVITSSTVWKYDDNKEATAVGTANNYVLSFDGLDTTVNVTYDAAIGSLPEAPAKTGYTFDAWYIGETKLESTTVWNYAENKQAVARYNANQYTLSFKDIAQTITVTYDSPIGNLPAVPSKTGYNSSSWMIDGNEISSNTVWNFTTNKQATYTQSAATYTLSFEGLETTITVTYGEAVGELPAVPSRTGYTGKWMLNGEELTATTVYNFAENKQATVEWTAIKYRVTFEGADVDAQIVAFGGTAIEPGTPEKEGYVFEGWFVKQADGSLGEQFDFSTVITGDITLVAKWKEASKGGCGGSIAATSAIIALTSLAGLSILAKKKKED